MLCMRFKFKVKLGLVKPVLSSGRYFRDFRFRDFSRVLSIGIESFRDPKSLENFLMHFSTGILTLNAHYSLQKNEYTIIRLLYLD